MSASALLQVLGVDLPIVQAPMAGSGGVALAAAVASAGGLGSLPGAMLTGDQLVSQIDEFRAAVDAPLNVNFFCHDAPHVSAGALARWATVVARFDAALGVHR